ncbi:MAG: hypothetical protein WC736_15310 [Gallionella sp.]|jgi:hypothetical protein
MDVDSPNEGPVSPITPIDGETPGAYTIVKTAAVAPVIVGTTGQIVLHSSMVRGAAFGLETVEEYHITNGQEEIARKFMNDCWLQETCIDVTRRNQCGDNTIIEVSWAYDRGDAAWQPGSDARLWDFEVYDTSQPLMSHPYFGRRTNLSAANLDILLTEMGACDQALALGKKYTLITPTAPAEVQTIMTRYAGHRYAGCDEWSPITIVLKLRYRLYQSQTGIITGTSPYGWSTVLSGINRSVKISAYDPPAHITTALSSVEQWSYSDSNPDPTVSNATFAWIRQKPLIALSGRNPNGPSDITEFFVGVQQASAVLFPPANVEGVPTGWDPIKDITA